MPPVTASIEIARPPEAVFAYATDFTQFPQWQGSVTLAYREERAPLAVGSRARVTRQIGPRTVVTTEEIIAFSPPQMWAVRGAGGVPVDAIFTGMIEPLEGGKISRVTLTLEFEPRGVGKLLVPLVIRRQARRQLPRNACQLKEMLEHDTAAS